jgi:hypothetical protein
LLAAGDPSIHASLMDLKASALLAAGLWRIESPDWASNR